MSHHEQYAEVGRLVVEHGERRKEFALIVNRLRQIAGVFTSQQATLNSLNPENYAVGLAPLRMQLEANGLDKYASGVLELLGEYDRVREHLRRDLETLKQYGVH